MISIIILSGGVGSRFGATIPKQFVTIAGKKIIDITIEKFLLLRPAYEVEIIVVSHPSRMEAYPGVKIVEGSTTRFASFLNGYHAINPQTKKVLVHDAVRPLISIELIIQLIDELNSCDAVIPVIKPYSSTVTEIDGKIQNINRDIINMTQTPEAFTKRIFDKLYDVEASDSNERTSIFSLFVDNQHRCHIKLIPGNDDNIKITTKSDLDLAIHLLEKKELPIAKLSTLKGKNALVLGGTGNGIGSAITKSLTDCGANVIITDSSLEIEKDGALQCFETQTFDIIVHSVGTLAYKGKTIIKDFNETTIEEFKYCMDLMLTSAYQTAKLASKTMTKGGHLLFIGSSSAYKGREQFALYSTPKAALNVFVESIATEFYRKYDIKTNIINPSITDTRMIKYLSSYARNKDKLPTVIVATYALRYLTSEAYGHKYLIRIGD